MAWGRRALVAVMLLALAAGCGVDAEAGAGALDRASVTPTTPTAQPDPTTTAPTPAPTTTTPTTTTPTTTEPAAPPSTGAPPMTTPPVTTDAHPARALHEQAWTPYATAGSVTLHHPSDLVEAIGFHQSGHDGAQQQAAVAGAARWFTMASRDRDTGPQGAADIVVPPDHPIRAPVTGTVIRGGTYTLYCDHVDEYAVIEPEARPGWEVKVLHVEGLALTVGQHVDAGITPLAARARVLPFPSQVEDDTGVPAWPHVHVEVVDPSVPDRPTGPGCP